MTTKETLLDLADRVDGFGFPFSHELLDIECAEALGWRQRRVTRLGVNGRTVGSYLWFSPDEVWGDRGARKPPRLSGPKRRKSTAAALRALAETRG